MPPHSIARVVERERNKTIDTIFEEAEERRLSLADLSLDLGVSTETVRNYLSKYGFELFQAVRRKRG